MDTIQCLLLGDRTRLCIVVHHLFDYLLRFSSVWTFPLSKACVRNACLILLNVYQAISMSQRSTPSFRYVLEAEALPWVRKILSRKDTIRKKKTRDIAIFRKLNCEIGRGKIWSSNYTSVWWKEAHGTKRIFDKENSSSQEVKEGISKTVKEARTGGRRMEKWGIVVAVG